VSLKRKVHAIAAAVLSLAFSQQPAFSEDRWSSRDEDPIPLELSTSDHYSNSVMRARGQVLAILESENSCSAWFREANPDTAEIFESLHYKIRRHDAAFISRVTDERGDRHLKDPWSARTTQAGGPDSTILLNLDGSFFKSSSPVMQMDGTFLRPVGHHSLFIASFPGNTAEAKIIILLHELGHVVGRLPADDDSWDGRSSHNTEEVVRHCKQQIRPAAEKPRQRD
jgi:hypothetical protein